MAYSLKTLFKPSPRFFLLALLVLLLAPLSVQAQQQISLRIFEPLQPEERVKKYEDPINAHLRSLSLGNVTEGGMATDAKTGQVSWVTINAEVASIDQTLPSLRKFLKEMGTPTGTVLTLRYNDTRVVETPLYEEEANKEDNSGLIIVLVYLILFLGAGGGVAFYLYKKKKAESSISGRARSLSSKDDGPGHKLY